MVLPNFSRGGFDDLHEKFEEGGFANTIWADDGDSGGKVDTEF